MLYEEEKKKKKKLNQIKKWKLFFKQNNQKIEFILRIKNDYLNKIKFYKESHKIKERKYFD